MTQQVVLITGALTGIGHATAVAFANKGAKVVVSGRHDDKGQADPVGTAAMRIHAGQDRDGGAEGGNLGKRQVQFWAPTVPGVLKRSRTPRSSWTKTSARSLVAPSR